MGDTGQSLLIDAGDIVMGAFFHTEFHEEAFELRLMGEMDCDAARPFGTKKGQ